METKYYCEKCQYKCNYQSEWNEHLESKKHTGEKRKSRSDKKLEDKCKCCNYIPKNLTNYKLHYLNNHANTEERIKEFTFYCEKCNFGCFEEILYQRHIDTKKHKNNYLY